MPPAEPCFEGSQRRRQNGIPFRHSSRSGGAASGRWSHSRTHACVQSDAACGARSSGSCLTGSGSGACRNRPRNLLNEEGTLMSPRSALVIGAGIAGPAVAIALRRAGIEPVVYEASPAPRDDEGAFLNLAPNGIAVLRALGVEHALEGQGFLNDRLVFHNDGGRVLAQVAVGGVTLMRGAFSRVLRDAAAQLGVRFEFGKSVE